MTIITAVHDLENKCVWTGANNRATIGNIAGPATDKKWIALGGWILGITGTGPKAEALNAQINDFPADAENIIDVLTFIKKAYEKFDIGENDEGLKRYCGSGMIVHKSGKIWDFDNSLCLTEIPSGLLWAQGSGMDMAIGAARALETQNFSKRELTQQVVEIVTQNDVDCPGEAHICSFDSAGNFLNADSVRG